MSDILQERGAIPQPDDGLSRWDRLYGAYRDGQAIWVPGNVKQNVVASWHDSYITCKATALGLRIHTKRQRDGLVVWLAPRPLVPPVQP